MAEPAAAPSIGLRRLVGMPEEKLEDLRDLFVPNFYFGCEADDPMVTWAFNAKTNPMGAKFKAMMSSDIGHWDVTDMNEVVEEAHELVDEA